MLIMKAQNIHRSLTVVSLLFLSATFCLAQQPVLPKSSPQPPPAEGQEHETIKVFTEEVLLPVVASDEYGRFDPTLVPEDILVLENNIPRPVKSVRHVPANVLLVLDMGSQLTSLTKTTREYALKLLATLKEGDQIAIIQNSHRVEVLQEWTTDTEKAAHIIKTQLFPSSRSRLFECLTAAVRKLKEKPVGNAHLVLVTDGIETRSSGADYPELVSHIVGTQATVHAICYSPFSRESLKGRSFGLDFEMRRWYERHGELLKQNDERLLKLIAETGGQISLPTSVQEVAQEWEDVVRNTKAQYIITYSPKRPFKATAAGERRSIRVHARRSGLQLIAMRNYVVVPG